MSAQPPPLGANWKYVRCVSLRNLPGAPIPLPSTSTRDTVITDCAASCARTQAPYILLQDGTCRCSSETDSTNNLITQNPAECSQTCGLSGQWPCGNSNTGRFSVYTSGLLLNGAPAAVTRSKEAPSLTTVTAVATIPTTTLAAATNPIGVQPTNVALISAPPPTSNTATTVAVSISALIFLLTLVGLIILRIRKRRALHSLPYITSTTPMTPMGAKPGRSRALSHPTKPHTNPDPHSLALLPNTSESATHLLILSHPGGPVTTLPKTPNMIYSVTSAHTASTIRSDEIGLKADDVVIVNRTWPDSWATGMNVSTGEVGVFPLACLANGEGWRKAVWGCPERKESLTV
ncbi:uncharacterized protein EV422DRAFT_514043 [Fimicolochytrium jonesii]|uniref:uncharacterized protein n=1 Tax=Fimicolochytrium jonesii TaxID=1396493 RepID=UPI0022FDCA57|nr:uncharacterized protein EV422DRAFT_514043 [Fimicolochytrium jonesii]KAI8825751.1 hypothetical protein EV422DRAFT_514043 [Fimicolochytrium jonesii]